MAPPDVYKRQVLGLLFILGGHHDEKSGVVGADLKPYLPRLLGEGLGALNEAQAQRLLLGLEGGLLGRVLGCLLYTSRCV